MKYFLSIIFTIFFLCACSQESSQPLNQLKLSNNGVNSINSRTPYTLNALYSKLLGYDINEYTTFLHQKPVNIMQITYNKQEVMIIKPDKKDKNSSSFIKSIIITSDFVKNPFNLEINSVFKENPDLTCSKSKDEIICKKQKYENIKIVYKKDKTNEYLLKEFIWEVND